MIPGSLKASGIAIGEFTANILGHTVKLVAKAAFVDPRTGQTHGWTSCESWTPSTMEKMREFIEAMEQDLGRQHFHDFAPAAGGVADVAKPAGIPAGGIGEHVGGDGEQV